MRTVLFAAALSALAVPAFAASWTATTAQSVHATGFVGESVAWDCNANECHASSDTSDADAGAECRGVARNVGALTAFSGRSAFTEAQLADCNKSARK